MSVFIDVWHRTHPLTREAHRRFLDYYGRYVVSPPSEFFEVVAGFRYLDGPTSEDFALYRYASMAQIEASMRSFGADADFIRATQELFGDIEIEETRGIGIHAPHSSDERLDGLIGESKDRLPRRFWRSVRTCGGTDRPEVFALLARRAEAVEKAGLARLAVALEYWVGPVMDVVEIWCLSSEAAHVASAHDPMAAFDSLTSELVPALDQRAPEREGRRIEPTNFSRLR